MFIIGVKSETIIRKMMDELQQAAAQQGNSLAMLRHIENVHLLSGLMVENKGEQRRSDSVQPEISNQEMKAMILGEQVTAKQVQQSQEHAFPKANLKVKEESDDSIFDF